MICDPMTKTIWCGSELTRTYQSINGDVSVELMDVISWLDIVAALVILIVLVIGWEWVLHVKNKVKFNHGRLR